MAARMSAKSEAMDLGERTRPRQARSRATVARILETSAILLDEVGFEGFNTNLLAERAAVGMQAIYRYFPNKASILLALSEDMREAELGWVGDLTRLDAPGDWQVAVRSAIARFYEGAAARPGYAALRNAVRASPEMQAADRELNSRLENELAAGLRRLGVQIADDRMAVVCRTIMETATRIIDIALEEGNLQAPGYVEELSEMITAYLDRYVPRVPPA